MRHVRLIAASDEFDNKPGLIIKGTPSNDDMMADRDGLLIAHDLIEHQNGARHIGSVWDEMEALGGIWHARGQWGDMMTPSVHSPAVNVAADLTRMFCENWRDEFPPREHRVKATKPCDYDEAFLEIIALARHDIPREYDDEDVSREDLDAYLTQALHRMRTGFRKANRRFGRHRFESNSLFRAVKDAVERAIKYELEFEGQEFILSYGDGRAECRAVWEYDE